MKLWYRAPAREWLEGVPIGTGRLAAMVLGTFRRERIALNHECLWKGVYRHRDNAVSRDALPEVRRLLLAGNYADGTRKARDAFGGGGGGSGRPQRVDPYQPAGDLHLELLTPGPIADYRRELDLDTASATVSYVAGGRRFPRQYVAHLVEDLILVRLTHDGEPFDCVAWLDRTYDADCELSFATDAPGMHAAGMAAAGPGGADAETASLTMTGEIHNGVAFRVRGDVWCRGGRRRVVDGRKLLCEGVTEALFAVDIGVTAFGTSAAEECGARRLHQPRAWDSADWDDLFRAHVGEHERHFGSMRLDLALGQPEAADLPTDERIRRVREGQPDPGLPLLYFHYGRYLLCASSANAALPANLQGKWNEDLQPPWASDYHHDINLQMNYWSAEPAGMQRYVEALLQHIERFVPHARKAATDLYGCRGVWYPIQTDAWGRSTPESHGWAVWIGAAPWLAQHVWWHWEYGRDADFLRTRAYPFFKEVAAFFEDYLVEDDAGALQIVPSQSPENRFVGDGGPPVSICVSATMDVILARAAFDYAIRSAEILDLDPELRRRWRDMAARLPGLQIGRHGQLQEWNEDFDEVEPAHRHVSHLIGLYPGDLLDPQHTPELWRAAEVSLQRRLAAGGGHTGWSRAWTACLFARLGRGEDAWEHLNHLITEFATDSLLDLHPPRIFQIDGNLGGAAAVVEMLLQSYRGELHLLPALPAAWPEGRVTGLRARGGVTVAMAWRGGALTEATLEGRFAAPCTVLHAPDHWQVTDAAGRDVPVTRTGHRITFPLSPGERYRLLTKVGGRVAMPKAVTGVDTIRQLRSISRQED
ncbi:MAG: glycoside hydrolase N-terminal domain-containing protein [Spirochaetaceae bacterium]|nr:glycoside hydrolase N-terminal domain-containing protein [Spirochaetaceae bacterium]